MKKVFLFALACMAAVSAQAKEPKWFLNEKPLPEKHILATSSLDSIVVQKSDGSIHAWAEKGIEWKPLVELVSPKLQSRHVAENLYFSVDGTFYGRLDKIDRIYIDADYVDAHVEEAHIPREKYIRAKYRGRKLIKIRLRNSWDMELKHKKDQEEREIHKLWFDHIQNKQAQNF